MPVVTSSRAGERRSRERGGRLSLRGLSQHRLFPRGLSPRAAFWFTAAAFAAQMGFGTAPTPLWPLYEARDGFGPTTVTIAFALLVVGAAVSFLVLGHLSDRYGRRRVIIPALLVAIASALVLLLWPALPGLLIGRLMTGLALGLMASTATTYITDLHALAYPDRRGSAVPALVATVANLGGLALGPLVAGVVAQWAPRPLVSVQGAFAVALAVLLALVAGGPETVGTRAPARERPARFALRPEGGWGFAAAGGLGAAAFATFGLFSSLGAVMIHDRLGISSPFAGALPGFVTFLASAVAQLGAGRVTARRPPVTGVVLLPVGLALVAVSLGHPMLWLYLVASAIAGAAAGLLFKAGVGEAGRVAAPASRAGVLAVFFVVSYVGMGLPVILFSVAAEYAGPLPAMIGFAAALSAGAALATAAQRRRPGWGS
ncbi:MFS transporter [Microbispora sp. RL4-1S]|uniref:MFS transporter n=1 Tax=Microbispora oryzae TaxID=2806554 RepID=A0A941AIF6_9ACTN|nr:MFS transporter [Microbispora oryzae]MBP2703797.1 MFS transporter [Microbispora oryzae]